METAQRGPGPTIEKVNDYREAREAKIGAVDKSLKLLGKGGSKPGARLRDALLSVNARGTNCKAFFYFSMISYTSMGGHCG